MMCRWQFQVAIGDSVPKQLRLGSVHFLRNCVFQDVAPGLGNGGGRQVPETAARPHNDQLTRVTTHVPARFRSIHRWLPRACLGVESSAEENVVL